MRGGWNHNTQYHNHILRSVPDGCGRALEIGCGEGKLAFALATQCKSVTAMDTDAGCLARAQMTAGWNGRVTFIEGDVMSHPLVEESFDLITMVAVLHHLPLRPALARCRSLLRAGGILAAVGLYRNETTTDYALAAAALPASWFLRLLRGHAEMNAPMHEPRETLQQIRRAYSDILPGSQIRRRLFFRYTVLYRKP
jgi:2-polyprenyl-3-methyl-5-hydroxy-6-metoxy-1,4-benzoquinol methylase